MVSVIRFKSSSTQKDVHFINNGLIKRKIDNKAGYALRSQDILSSSSVVKPLVISGAKKQDGDDHQAKPIG